MIFATSGSCAAYTTGRICGMFRGFPVPVKFMNSALKSYKTNVMDCAGMGKPRNMLHIRPVVYVAQLPDFAKIIIIGAEMSEISADQ
jgi:hypothetical protein